MTDQPTFEYRDEDGDDLIARPMRGIPAVLILTGTNGIAVDLNRVEEVVAGVRDAALQAAGQTPTTEQPETCRPVEVDGTTALVRGSGDWTDEDQHHMAEIVRAAKRRYAAEHPIVEQPAEAQPADRAAAQKARARLAAFLGYEPGEHDALFESHLDVYRAATLREVADKLAALAEGAYAEALSNDDIGYANGLENAANELRRMADEETR